MRYEDTNNYATFEKVLSTKLKSEMKYNANNIAGVILHYYLLLARPSLQNRQFSPITFNIQRRHWHRILARGPWGNTDKRTRRSRYTYTAH